MMSMKFSETALQVLWHVSWQSALLAGIVFAVIQLIGRRITPSWRVALCAIPLVRMVVLVLPATSFSLFQWIDDPIAPILHATAVIQPTLRALPTPAGFEPMSMRSHELPVTTADTGHFVPRTAGRPWALAAHLAIATWISGVAFLSIRWIGSKIALHRLLLRGERLSDTALDAFVEESFRQTHGVRRASCILTDEEIGPSTCGLVRPTIVLCKRMVNEFTTNDLRMIIAHELEHIRRFDCLLLVLGRLATTLHWFNPLAYFLSHRIHREMELAVDASTVGKLGESMATSYGQLLIRLANRPSRQLGLIQMAGRGSNLRRRVEQLMTWRKPRRWQWVLSGVIVSLLAFTGLSDTKRRSVAAQDSADAIETAAGQTATSTSNRASEAEGRPVGAERENKNAEAEKTELKDRAAGRVVDADGLPVPGARLFSEIYTVDGTLNTVSETCNQRGEFSIVYPEGRWEFESFRTWAYSKHHSIRVVRMGSVFSEQDGHVAEKVEIQLPPKETIALRVLLPTGDPCANAIVRPRYYGVPNGTFAANEPTGLSAPFPEELAALIGRRTSPDGSVSIESVPTGLLNSIVVETPELGRQHFRRFEETLQLVEVGSINGVLMADEPGQFAGTKVFVESEPLESAGPEGGLSLNSGTWKPQGIAVVEIDERGRFHVTTIAAGRLRLRVLWDSDSTVRPMLWERHRVNVNETVDVMIEVRPTILVTGQIVTSDTREPVVGARLHMRHPRDLSLSNDTHTNQQGRYSIRVPSGKTRRQVISLGSMETLSKYDHPRLVAIEIPAGVQSFEAEEIQISPRRLVNGVLLDNAGKPIGNATVVLHTGRRRHLAGKTETNLDGTFQMRVKGDALEHVSAKGYYWATLDRPAVNAEPPQLTQLMVLDDDPDALVLRKP